MFSDLNKNWKSIIDGLEELQIFGNLKIYF